MNMKKWKWRYRILFSVGLLMNQMTILFWNYSLLPDFVRGIFAGLGLGLMFWVLISQKSVKTSCFRSSGSLSKQEKALND
jgi:hypothetical protein